VSACSSACWSRLSEGGPDAEVEGDSRSFLTTARNDPFVPVGLGESQLIPLRFRILEKIVDKQAKFVNGLAVLLLQRDDLEVRLRAVDQPLLDPPQPREKQDVSVEEVFSGESVEQK